MYNRVMTSVLILTILVVQFSFGQDLTSATKDLKQAIENSAGFIRTGSHPATTTKAGQKLITDGFQISASDGKLVESPQRGWLFIFESVVNDKYVKLKPGTKLGMLPSVALENMIIAQKSDPNISFRIWGKITKFDNKNYIFGTYFLPFKTETRKIEITTDSSNKTIQINDPNDTLPIPAEIIKKLTNRKVIRTAQLQKPLEIKEDSVLVNRTGFVVNKNGGYIFVLDAIGRNLPRLSFELLPCETLGESIKMQAKVPDLLRFKVSGIVTKFDGKYYLLLHRATRVYSYGNLQK